MANFTPVKIVEQFTKAVGALQVPRINVDSIIAAQRKNIEALTAANKPTVEGVQALANRQTEIMQEVFKEATDRARNAQADAKASSKGDANQFLRTYTKQINE